jgi:hypothetical protein
VGADLLSACRAQVKPTHVLNAAGVTGRPNVDWCEDHKVGRGQLVTEQGQTGAQLDWLSTNIWHGSV